METEVWIEEFKKRTGRLPSFEEYHEALKAGELEETTADNKKDSLASSETVVNYSGEESLETVQDFDSLEETEKTKDYARLSRLAQAFALIVVAIAIVIIIFEFYQEIQIIN